MTREEAIDMLKHPDEMYHGTDGIVGYTFNPNGRNYEAFQLAIKALEQQRPMEKFENAKDHIYKLASDYKCWDNRLTEYEALELCHILEQEPSKDTISRKKLIKDLNFLYNEDGYIKDTRAKRTMEVIMGQSPVNPQESILDKIREEIEKIPTAPFATAYTARRESMNIIDKYKSESEDKK